MYRCPSEQLELACVGPELCSGHDYPKRSWVLLWGILSQIIITVPNIETYIGALDPLGKMFVSGHG